MTHSPELVWGMNASSIDELVETIFDQYEKYDGDTMEPVSYTHLTLPTICSV